MVKVELPRADWDLLLILLESDHWNNNFNVAVLRREIDTQVYSQEY